MRLIKIVLLFCTVSPCVAQREVIALDGQWDIADSQVADVLPTEFVHQAPVPGLAHSSTPGFPDSDAFSSRQLILNRIAQGQSPASELVRNAGVSGQDRNWFWYHRSFKLAGKRNVAVLHINKAQFGAAVWLNGKKIGEHLPCFTAAIFDVSDFVRWDRPNDLIVRVGAHPGVLPKTVSGGTDFEKNRWTPGIYDSVFLTLSDNPVITTVQVAPKLDTMFTSMTKTIVSTRVASTMQEFPRRLNWEMYVDSF